MGAALLYQRTLLALLGLRLPALLSVAPKLVLHALSFVVHLGELEVDSEEVLLEHFHLFLEGAEHGLELFLVLVHFLGALVQVVQLFGDGEVLGDEQVLALFKLFSKGLEGGLVGTGALSELQVGLV